MCIATPETVLSIEEAATGPVGTILHAGRVISVDLSLVPEAKVGDTILFFRGNALRVIEETNSSGTRSSGRSHGRNGFSKCYRIGICRPDRSPGATSRTLAKSVGGKKCPSVK